MSIHPKNVGTQLTEIKVRDDQSKKKMTKLKNP